MIAKRKKPRTDQHKAFKATAHALECDESEKAFDKALGKIAKAKPNVAKGAK
jgi:hypothetical protein